MSLAATQQYWDDQAYIAKYGAEQFFTDMDHYEKLTGKDWATIVNQEKISLKAIHQIALKALEKT